MPETTTPAVSVVLPTYNRCSVLLPSLQSVLCQLPKDSELIVVDDCSSDGTQELVESLDDNRIVYLRHEVNQGGAVARNTGIEVARGRYVAFQDSDDYWLPGKLDRQLAILDGRADCGAVYSGFLRWDGAGARYIPRAGLGPREGDLSKVLLGENLVNTPTLVVRREILEDIGGFDAALPRFQDWDLAIRLSRVCRFAMVDEPLVLARLSPDSLSLNHQARARALEMILVKYREEFSARPRTEARHARAIAHFSALGGDGEAARAWFRRAIRLHPLRPEAWVARLFLAGGEGCYRWFADRVVPLVARGRQ